MRDGQKGDEHPKTGLRKREEERISQKKKMGGGEIIYSGISEARERELRGVPILAEDICGWT